MLHVVLPWFLRRVWLFYLVVCMFLKKCTNGNNIAPIYIAMTNSLQIYAAYISVEMLRYEPSEHACACIVLLEPHQQRLACGNVRFIAPLGHSQVNILKNHSLCRYLSWLAIVVSGWGQGTPLTNLPYFYCLFTCICAGVD